MRHREGHFSGTGNVTLYRQYWVPDASRAVVLIAHGLGEHSGRYRHVAMDLVGRGYTVLALDHRGHGRSQGRRGHVERWGDFIADLDLVRHQAAAEFPGQKVFLLGHSMGGLIAALDALQHPAELAGLITSSAAFEVEIKANPVKLALGRFFSQYVPGLTMSNELDPDHVSRDPQVVAAYIADPLVHDRVSARWFTEFVAAIARANELAPTLKLPLLVMQSADDQLVVPAGAEKFYARAGSADKTLKVWPGMYHEMFNEPAKADVLAFLAAWLDARV